MPQGWLVSPEASLLSAEMTVSILCPHKAVLCVCPNLLMRTPVLWGRGPPA